MAMLDEQTLNDYNVLMRISKDVSAKLDKAVVSVMEKNVINLDLNNLNVSNPPSFMGAIVVTVMRRHTLCHLSALISSLTEFDNPGEPVVNAPLNNIRDEIKKIWLDALGEEF